MTARAWVLNFDADDELASHGPYTTPPAVAQRFRALAERLGGLVAPGDVVLWDDLASPASARGLDGYAFSPTPSALARLRRAGAVVPAAPDVSILRAVNHRRFSSDLGQTLPGAAYVTALPELLAVLDPGAGAPWLLKRPFGFAGRGRRRVTSGALDAGDLRFVEATLRAWGGLQVEPWVDRSADFALHGEVGARGDVRLGVPTVQRCDEHGAWLATAIAAPGELSPAEESALVGEASRAGSALAAAGYFGPFGVDAYRYRAAGREVLNPRSEINARYSMGWAIGMQQGRPAARAT